MLLTDKALKALKPDVPMCNADPTGKIVNCESCSGQCKVVAGAQLKKVVEELDTFKEKPVGEEVRLFIDRFRQALLKEPE